jgi:hypothetical protein
VLLDLEELTSKSPLLADKIHVKWTDGIDRVVDEIISAISKVDVSAEATAIATRDRASTSSELLIEVKGTWWAEFAGARPLYVRIAITHMADKPDAVKRATVEIAGQQIGTEEPDKLPGLAEAAFKDLVLKFSPSVITTPTPARLVIETVRGLRANAAFDTWYGGWRPSDEWNGFKPY